MFPKALDVMFAQKSPNIQFTIKEKNKIKKII